MSAEDPCIAPCTPFFVGYYEYTARCLAEGMNGTSVTVRRYGRSQYSEAHATALARELAKAEAEAELRCFTATECVTPVCDGVSAFDPICRTEVGATHADATANALAAATLAAQEFCESLP